MGGMLGFFRNQLSFKPQPLPATVSLEGQTALITGANSGLGFEVAKELASHKLSRLIIAVRDESKGEASKQSIVQEYSKCAVDVWTLDYDSYDSIIAFGTKAASLERLDYVLLNAGIKKVDYSTSIVTGHEQNVQINHIATSLLSLLLLPTMQRTAQAKGTPARMTLVTSEGHFWVPFKEQKASNILARMDERSSFGSNMQRYYTSKLLNVLWTRELASKVDSDKIIINCVNPGFCHSGLHRHEKNPGIKVFLWIFAWTSIQGGYCLADALVRHEKSHGEYLSEQQVKLPSPFVLSEKGSSSQKQLWKETVELLKKEAPNAEIPAFGE